MRVVDLNSDLGESFGAYTIGMDEQVLRHISSANVACGWHAGDPVVMERTVRAAAAAGTADTNAKHNASRMHHERNRLFL